MSHASTGSLTLDRIRFHQSSAAPVVGFAPLRADEVTARVGVVGVIEPRAVEDVCEVACRPCDAVDDDSPHGVGVPTPGGSGVVASGFPIDATGEAGDPSRTFPADDGSGGAPAADSGTGGNLDVFA